MTSMPSINSFIGDFIMRFLYYLDYHHIDISHLHRHVPSHCHSLPQQRPFWLHMYYGVTLCPAAGNLKLKF